MVYCINCGKQNKSDFDFCYNCGAKLVKSSSTDAPGPETPAGQSPDQDKTPPFATNPTPPPPQPGPYSQPTEAGPVPPPTYTGSPASSRPDFRPPYPYGYPPIPRRTETQRFPVA